MNARFLLLFGFSALNLLFMHGQMAMTVEYEYPFKVDRVWLMQPSFSSWACCWRRVGWRAHFCWRLYWRLCSRSAMSCTHAFSAITCLIWLLPNWAIWTMGTWCVAYWRVSVGRMCIMSWCRYFSDGYTDAIIKRNWQGGCGLLVGCGGLCWLPYWPSSSCWVFFMTITSRRRLSAFHP